MLIFFCQIVEEVIAIRAITVAINPRIGISEPISKPKTKSEDSSVQVYRDQAHSWIFKDVGVTCEDFEEICFYAGLEPSVVRKFATNVINSEDVSNVRRKFQALL